MTKSLPGARRLRANALIYESLLSQLETQSSGDDEFFRRCESLAWFAWQAHAGRFADGALENLVLARGQALGSPPSADLPTSELVDATLHVATEVYPIGGHSRVLTAWMQGERHRPQTLVLTRQNHEIPVFLSDLWTAQGVRLVRLDPKSSVIARATQLRQLARDTRRVVLHQHPNDVVPIVAFAKRSGAPVIMFNHAHFWFSMGTSVADIVVNTLPFFESLSQRERFARATHELAPTTIGLASVNPRLDKTLAKRALGLREDAPVAVCIGSEHYFEPQDGEDFFAVLAHVIAAFPTLQVLLVGVDPTSWLVPEQLREHAAIRLIGIVPDIRPYCEAADIALESFPMPSLGAFSEAVRLGEAYPIPALASTAAIRRPDLPHISAFVVRAKSESEYIAQISVALSDLKHARTIARTIGERMSAYFASFPELLDALYARADTMGHEPHALPVSGCHTGADHIAMASTSKVSVLDAIASRTHGAVRMRLLLRALIGRHVSLRTVARALVSRLRRIAGDGA